MNTTHPLRARVAVLLTLVAAAIAAWLPSATARADAFGQLASWGSVGTGAGQFFKPTEMGVDPSDGSVYVLDQAADLESFRLQKLSSTGTPLASATIPRTPDGAGNKPVLMGIQVDATLRRVYLLRFRAALDTVTGQAAAEQIDVFSTQESSGTLVVPGDVPTGKLAVPSPTGASAIDRPRGFALDPSSHDLLVLGYDPAGNVVVQRISSAGAALGRYVDSDGSTLRSFSSYSAFNGLAVADDGSVFLGQGTLSDFMYVYEITPALDRATSVVAARPPAGEAWGTWGGGQPATGAQTASGLGRQLAVSPDGDTLYWPERVSAETTSVAGNYVVRGYSIRSGATSVIYGGNRATGTCSLTHLSIQLALDGSGNLYALDPGNWNIAAPTYGATVTKFGPGGSGCPAPVASFTIGGSSDARVAVQKGATVAFDASGSALGGGSPSELAWDFDGSGSFATVIRGAPADLRASNRFLQAGTFAVGLRMSLTGSAFGNPPIVTKTVTVVAGTPTAAFRASTSSPAAGATVTFDASSSVDPTGSDTAGPTSRLRTYRWDFGDGQTQTTGTARVDHAFANAATTAVSRTVRLTVTSFDDVSASTSQTISVQGTPGDGGGGGGGDTGGGGGDARGPGIVAPIVPDPGRATLSSVGLRSTNAALGIACAASPGACAGTVTLVATLPAPVRRGARRGRRARAHPTTVGRVSFSLAAGARAVVVVKLSRAARALLARARRLGVTVRIETRNSAGRTATSTKRVTLVVPRARRGARRAR